MGTTLTGTTPQDTYDSLIKVTDNGPLSGTAKYLSDGLGNDSALAVSTSKVGVGTASLSLGKLVVKDSAFQYIAEPTDTATYGYLGIGHFTNGAFIGTTAGSNTVSDVLRFGTSGTERMRITSTGNVGIGTSAPNFILEAAGTTGIGVRSTGVDGVYTDILSSVYSGNANEQNAIQASVSGVASDSGFRFQVSNGSGLSTQTVGYQLNKDRHIFYANGSERVRVTTDGLTFNGDTAAANALDDYEEGDWTPAITFGGGSTGITYASRSGKYTKIGRQVSVTGYILLTSKGSSTGSASIEGLPFAVGNAVGFYSAATLGALSSVTFSGVPSGYGAVGGSKVELVDTLTTGTQLGISNTNFTNSSQILLQFTYFV